MDYIKNRYESIKKKFKPIYLLVPIILVLLLVLLIIMNGMDLIDQFEKNTILLNELYDLTFGSPEIPGFLNNSSNLQNLVQFLEDFFYTENNLTGSRRSPLVMGLAAAGKIDDLRTINLNLIDSIETYITRWSQVFPEAGIQSIKEFIGYDFYEILRDNFLSTNKFTGTAGRIIGMYNY